MVRVLTNVLLSLQEFQHPLAGQVHVNTHSLMIVTPNSLSEAMASGPAMPFEDSLISNALLNRVFLSNVLLIKEASNS